MGAGLLAACGGPLGTRGAFSGGGGFGSLSPGVPARFVVLPGHSGTGRGMMISLLCVRLPAGEPSDHAGPGT